MKKQFLFALLASTALTGSAAISAEPADVLIAGGTVYNGEDKPAVVEDVVIAGDKIVYVGKDAASKYSAKNTINAAGKIVSPGFIDGHSHPEHWLNSADAADRNLPQWITQGTAILLMGIEAEGTPNITDEAARFAKQGIGANLVPFVGYGVLRGPDGVMGEANRKPTPEEMEKAKALIDKGMCEGGWGLSINLFSEPDIFSTTEEIIPLAAEAGKFGGIYHVHERDEASYTIGLMGATLESIRVGREGHLPVQITHIKAIGPDVWGFAPKVIAAINAARAEGVNVTADQYPWAAASSSVEKMLAPRWAQDGGHEALLKRLDDPALLPKIKDAIKENLRIRGGASTLEMVSTGYPWTGKTITQMGEIWHLNDVDTVVKILKDGGTSPGKTPGDSNGGALVSYSLNEKDIVDFMKQPWMTTSSDGGQNHPRTYATFPRKYEKYAVQDKVITVQQFIRSATGLEADFLHLDRRGYLKPGYFADVVVFDPTVYKQRADYVHWDVPTLGVDALFINGQLAVSDSKVTGVLAGRTILHKPIPGTCP